MTWIRKTGLAVGLALLMRTNLNPPPRLSSVDKTPLAPVAGQPWFIDVTAAAGIQFRHFDPATPMQYIHETLGSGLGWIDYNNDGWLDLVVVQDGPAEPGAAPNPARADMGAERAQLLLEPWAVQAALRRRRGGNRLTDRERDEIRRCTRDPDGLRWPKEPGE